jgi:hypothetical protein
MDAGSLCFEFSAQVVAGNAANARFLVAVASKETFEVGPYDDPADPTYSRYMVRSSVRGSVEILKDDVVAQTFPGKGEASLTSPTRFFVRLGNVGERGQFVVQFGRATASGELDALLAQFADAAPFRNANYVSFSAAVGASVLFTNIKPCVMTGQGLGKGLNPQPPQTGSGGGGGLTSPPTSKSVPTAAPTPPPVAVQQPPPTTTGTTFDTTKCNQFSNGPAQCRGKSGLACRWKNGRCLPKPANRRN